MFFRKYIGWIEVDQRIWTRSLTEGKSFIKYNLKSNGCTTDICTNVALMNKHKFILLCNKRLMYIPVYQCFFFNEIFIPYVLHSIFTKKS